MIVMDSNILDVVYSQSSLRQINYHMSSTRGKRDLSWALTKHAQKRISQRLKSYQSVLTTIEYGIPIFKQGLCFYVATNKSLPKKINSKLRQQALNTVVVTSSDGSIVTCYKSKDALKNIRKKNNHLV